MMHIATTTANALSVHLEKMNASVIPGILVNIARMKKLHARR
jgi:hypothetical protein